MLVSRILLLTLGAWAAVTLAVAWVATANFRVTSRLRNADQVFRHLPESERGPALRYVAGELNRNLFRVYDVANLLFAIAAIPLLWLSGRSGPWTIGALVCCAGIAAALLFWLTPTLVQLGRQIDFDRSPPEVSRFRTLHTLALLLDMGKLILLGFVTATLLRDSVPGNV